MIKEEILYNCKSLIYTWLDGVKNIDEMWVELSPNDVDNIHYCTLENCGECICDLLINNNGKYKLLQLYIKSDNDVKLVGSLDIL